MRALRVGAVRIEFETDNFQGYCSLLAANFEAEVQSGQALFSLTLVPGGENERIDEAQMHVDGYRRLTIRDEQLVESLKKFQTRHQAEIAGWAVVVHSRCAVYRHRCRFEPEPQGWLHVLILD